MVGGARRSTASNAPTTRVMITVAARANAPNTGSVPRDTRACQAARPSKARKMRMSNTVAGMPRSDANAAQSLLGHGFDVMPSSRLLIDGSPRDA